MNPSPTNPSVPEPLPNDQPEASTGTRLLSILVPFIAGASAMTAVDHIVAHKELNALVDVVCVVVVLGMAWRWSRG